MRDRALETFLKQAFIEDDIDRNFTYINSIPEDRVKCSLKLKDDLILSGLPFFCSAFNFLKPNCVNYDVFQEFEGASFDKADNSEISFDLPFNIALSGERIALNLLQKSSSISTNVQKYKLALNRSDITLLDTRKTTPGLRFLEKYAVVKGGGFNHRLGQTDCFMIKDNHKQFFGGVKGALDFFRSQHGFYTPIVLEIHDLAELELAIDLGIKHFMLDNFSPETIREAIKIKPHFVTFEASGGITIDNINNYSIEGLDAISSGALTYGARPVDISLKYERI